MYGVILLTVKNLVVTKFGEDSWKKLCLQVGVSENFDSVVKYDDELLYKLVGGISAMTKLSASDVIEAAGYWFVVYIRTTEYGKLFSIVGNTLGDTLKNINSLHGHLKVTNFKEATFPTFRTIPVDDCHLRIQYTPGLPSRVGLGPLVVGLVKGVAEIVHQISNISVTQSKIRGKGSSYDEFVVKWTPVSDSAEEEAEISSSPSISDRPTFGIDAKCLMQIHPFHIAFNKKMEITQAGGSISKVIGIDYEKPDLGMYFTYIEPKDGKIESFSNARNYWKNKETVILAHNSTGVSNFRLKGEFAYVRKKGLMFFIGTPLLQSVEEAVKFKLSLTDFALHDPVKDLIFNDTAKTVLAQSQSASDLSKVDNVSVTYSNANGATANAASNNNNNNTAKKKNVLQSLFGSKIPKTKDTPPPSPSMPSLTPLNDLKRSTTRDAELSSQCPFSSPSGVLTPRSQPMVAVETSDPANKKFHEMMIEDSGNGFPVTIGLLQYFHANSDSQCEDFYLAVAKYYACKNNRHVSLFRTVLDQELNETNCSPASLFREESVGVRLWSVIYELEGLQYFRKLVTQIHKIIDKYDIEEDVSKRMTPALAAKLIECGTEILAVIGSSAEECPPLLRLVLHYVYKRIEKKFPGMPFKGICSLLFLRGLFPAVLRPEKILLSLPVTRQKTTLMIIKMLQNLINGVEYDGSKEAHMVLLNAFVVSAESRDALNCYLEQLLSPASISVNQVCSKDINLSVSIIRDSMMARLPNLLNTPSPAVRQFFVSLLSAGLSSLQ